MGTTDGGDHVRWWVEARFGMFIHFGLYSLDNRGEWIMYYEHIPNDEYAKRAERFNPRHYNPREWVAMAQDAGMRYMVLTTRHHDGFCLFDSKASTFTAPRSAAKRDLIAEYAEASHSMGMPMGFYYSLMDWRFPGVIPHGQRLADEVYQPMVRQAHEQVRELLTNYGTVSILWYDGLMPHDPELWRSAELNAMARRLQPGIIINNRAGTQEDFGTPENVIVPEARPWEACYTMNETWGGGLADPNWKSVGQILYLLITCVSGGGNLLLNVAPDGDGRFPRQATDRLRQVGVWMRRNGNAIYSAGRSPVAAPSLGWGAGAGDKVYLYILRWPGETLPFAWCEKRVLSAKVLSTGHEARVEQKGDRVWLSGLPQYAPDRHLSVIELEVEPT